MLVEILVYTFAYKCVLFITDLYLDSCHTNRPPGMCLSCLILFRLFTNKASDNVEQTQILKHDCSHNSIRLTQHYFVLYCCDFISQSVFHTIITRESLEGNWRNILQTHNSTGKRLINKKKNKNLFLSTSVTIQEELGIIVDGISTNVG